MCQHRNIFYNFSAKAHQFHGTCLTVALLNSQSARNKVNLIGEAVIEHDIDILAFPETWLTNTPKDEYYTKELSFSVYKLINVPCPGGVLLLPIN